MGLDITATNYGRSDGLSFRAGSYSGYNWWRDQLAQMAYRKPAERVWAENTDGPFFELINFADNEGTIGPIACARLAEHFEAGRDTVRARLYDKVDGWDQQKYDEWARAFDLAANTGLVRFH